MTIFILVRSLARTAAAIYVLFLVGCGGGGGGDDGAEGEGAEVERASAVQWAFQFRYS